MAIEDLLGNGAAIGGGSLVTILFAFRWFKSMFREEKSADVSSKTYNDVIEQLKQQSKDSNEREKTANALYQEVAKVYASDQRELGKMTALVETQTQQIGLLQQQIEQLKTTNEELEERLRGFEQTLTQFMKDKTE